MVVYNVGCVFVYFCVGQKNIFGYNFVALSNVILKKYLQWKAWNKFTQDFILSTFNLTFGLKS